MNLFTFKPPEVLTLPRRRSRPKLRRPHPSLERAFQSLERELGGSLLPSERN